MEELIFPNKLRVVRTMKGKTMQSLADYIGLSISAVSKIEHGFRRLNQQQVLKVVEFLDCSFEDIFLSEDREEDRKILEAWKDEAEKRQKKNEASGLKTFGAGLRYLRNQIGLRMEAFAKKAGLTVSVYHRTEMGQRDVFEHELEMIAKALDMKTEDLLPKIKKLHDDGKLEDIIKTSKRKFKVFSPVDILNRNARTSKKFKVQLYSKVSKAGNVYISDKEKDIVNCPVELENGWDKAFAMKYKKSSVGKDIKKDAVIFADGNEAISDGDFAVQKVKSDQGYELIVWKIEKNGTKLVAQKQDPEESMTLTKSDLKSFHKVIYIK